jgi:hypothetical protein
MRWLGLFFAVSLLAGWILAAALHALGQYMEGKRCRD